MTSDPETCIWCGEMDATETLAINPRLALPRVTNELTKLAASKPRNGRVVKEIEAYRVGSREPLRGGTEVQNSAVLTLGEIRDTIRGMERNRVLRMDASLPCCKQCIKSITELQN